MIVTPCTCLIQPRVHKQQEGRQAPLCRRLLLQGRPGGVARHHLREEGRVLQQHASKDGRCCASDDVRVVRGANQDEQEFLRISQRKEIILKQR